MFKIEALACCRGKRIIFRDLRFELKKGDVLLVTGRNGSGKSSLLRALAGLLPATSGTISWNGKNIFDDPDNYRRNMQYIGHFDCLKPRLTVGETLDYWGALCGSQLTFPLNQDRFNVLALRDKPIMYLSAGQKRRLALSRLFLGTACVWLLDEPASTLDGEGQSILYDCITQHRAQGGIAIIATHHQMIFSDAQNYEMKKENNL